MLSPQNTSIAVNAANEGVPVAAIARIIREPMGDVYEVLKEEKSRGSIADLPRADWPPGSKITERLPSVGMPSDDDLSLLCKQTFKLTGLEAGFLVVLLKHRQVDKSRLHNIVEQKRSTRASQPNSQEATDPKMVDVMICKLRKKLKVVNPELKIETIWGGGYYVGADVKPKIIAQLNGEPHAPQEAPGSGCSITNGDPVARPA